MKRLLLLALAGLSLAGTAIGQGLQAATPAEQQEMLAKITAQSAKMKTLTCAFVQTKTLSLLQEKMVAKGLLYYKADSKVRWEYRSPYTYTFILNDKKMKMQPGTGAANVIDARSSKLFQAVIKIMTSCISGNGLTDSKSFKTTLYRGAKTWQAVLVPQQKEVRKMFASITFTFNQTDYSIDVVELAEPAGDTTTIVLSDKKVNEDVSDSEFSIN